jgi:hypothetical protein
MSLDKLKDLISETTHLSNGQSYFSLITLGTDMIDLKLSEEEVKYLEEPYKPTAIIGHS